MLSLLLCLLPLLGASATLVPYSSAEKAEILKIHNDARQAVGASPAEPNLVWNDVLESTAGEWAKVCSYGSTGHPTWKRYLDKPKNTIEINQNGWMGTYKPSASATVAGWLGEKPDYDEAKNTCKTDANGKKLKCGHYTQMVWAATTKIGCARVQCGSSNWAAFCDYAVGGNMGGERPYKKEGLSVPVVSGFTCKEGYGPGNTNGQFPKDGQNGATVINGHSQYECQKACKARSSCGALLFYGGWCFAYTQTPPLSHWGGAWLSCSRSAASTSSGNPASAPAPAPAPAKQPCQFVKFKSSAECPGSSSYPGATYITFSECSQYCDKLGPSKCKAFEFGSTTARCDSSLKNCRCYIAATCDSPRHHDHYNVYKRDDKCANQGSLQVLGRLFQAMADVLDLN